MGVACQSVNKKHATSKIKDKFSEFRHKFFEIWKTNPIYQFLQEDIDKIDKYHLELVTKGPEFFILEDFINALPKVNDLNKMIFNHLNKLYFNELNEVLQGMFPDPSQFFLNVIIFLLSNPNMSHKKHYLAESFINCYLTRPKKPKKKKKLDEENQEGETQGTTTSLPQVEPHEPLKKKLNIDTMQGICLFLVKFSRMILIYFLLNFIFILESSRSTDMFHYDNPIKNQDGVIIMYEYESTFISNFRFVNRDFNTANFDHAWRDFLLSPFKNRKYYILIVFSRKRSRKCSISFT